MTMIRTCNAEGQRMAGECFDGFSPCGVCEICSKASLPHALLTSIVRTGKTASSVPPSESAWQVHALAALPHVAPVKNATHPLVAVCPEFLCFLVRGMQ
jgi:hypothetical protein